MWADEKVKEILQKNDFLIKHNFDVIPLEDSYRSTIKYRRFSPNDKDDFCKYVENDFMGRLPSMSDTLSKEFKKSIFEIFGNAVEHSETETIFVCGQSFYHQNCMSFSITDIGIGFHKNVLLKTHQHLTPIDAIKWAMDKDTTTKQGSIPGGLGLKLIREFITLNKGKMQIASDYGYWELSDGSVTTKQFQNKFPGSAVNIKINISDPCLYCFEDEIAPEDIF